MHRVESWRPCRPQLGLAASQSQRLASRCTPESRFQRSGLKSNYFEVETGEPNWASGPRRHGQDSLYATQRRTGRRRRCPSRILVENPRSASTHTVQMKAAMALAPSVATFTYPPVLRTGSNTRPAKARRRPCSLAGSARYSATPNPSIEGTSTSRLRLLAAAPHVKR